MLKSLSRHPLLLVLAAALVVRMGILIALYPTLFGFEQTGAIHGSGAYDTYALNLLATGVYGKGEVGVPDAHIPPLYSYFLAAVYATLGRSGLAVGIVHTMLDLLSIATLYYLTRRLVPQSRVVALLAAMFYAFYPYLIFQNLTLIDTPLAMTLLYGWLLAMALLRDQPGLRGTGWKAAVTAGLLLGLGALVRTNIVLLAPLVALWFLFRLPLRTVIPRLAVVALVSLITVTPWLIRTYSVYGEFIPIALNGGENFYQGNNEYTVPYFNAGYDVQWVPPPGNGAPVASSEITPERSAALADAGWSYLRQHPDLIPELMWTKFLVHWSIDIAPARNPTAGDIERAGYLGDTQAQLNTQGELQITGLPPGDPVDLYSSSLFDVLGRLTHRLYFGGLFLLALVGCLMVLPLWRDVSLVWLVQFGVTFSYVLFHPATRYRAPTDPLLFILSAYALVVIWQWLRARRSQPASRALNPS